MAEFGITSAGFIRKPIDLIVTDNESMARELFGADIDLTVYSPVGLFVQMLSWKENLIWEQLEDAYNANWINTATGVNLDRLVEWGGISRKQAQPAILKDVKFTGTDGTDIPAGIIIETAQHVQFTTNTGEKITGGFTNINCTAVNAGKEGNVYPDTVIYMLDPISGVTDVTNPTPGEGGTEDETDDELRKRFKKEGSEGVGSSPEAIRNAINLIQGVSSVSVYENTKPGEDEDSGRPAKSVECIVDCDEIYNKQVAEAIFKTKSAGIESYGEIMEPYVNPGDGKTYNIWFNKPMPLNVRVNIGVKYSNNGITDLPDDVKNLIIANTIEYITGTGSGEMIFPWRIAAANRDIEGIVNIIVGMETTGYSEITSSPGKFVPSQQSGLNAGTYTMNVAVDQVTAVPISITVSADSTWADIAAAIQTGLNNAACAAEASIAFSRIRISSIEHGNNSKITITDDLSATSFIAALNNIVDIDPKIIPKDGKSIGAGEGIEVGFRELPYCESSFIDITQV